MIKPEVLKNVLRGWRVVGEVVAGDQIGSSKNVLSWG